MDKVEIVTTSVKNEEGGLYLATLCLSIDAVCRCQIPIPGEKGTRQF
jgi:hypothetical protein